MLRSPTRSTIALRPLATILFATFAACSTPGCGSDPGEDVAPPIEDTGGETSTSTDSGVPPSDSGSDTMTEETTADAGDDTADSGTDTEVTDTEVTDTGTDTEVTDTGTEDTGTDTEVTDTGTDDTGVVVTDSGTDTELPDTTIEDSGTDTAPVDSGTDTGPIIPTIVSLAPGYQHTCAAMSDGNMYCWGANTKGQLGDGTINATTAIPTTPALTNVKEVGTGDDVTCALLNDGSVKCAGWYFYGSLGDGRVAGSGAAAEMSFVGVTGLTGASKLYVGHLHSCVLMPDTTAKCWGYNDDGQIGIQSDTTTKLPTINDVKAVGGTGAMTGITAMSLGRSHTCAVLSDKTPLCWGQNWYGQIGNGVATPSSSTPNVLVPTQPVGVTDVQQIESGTYHTCALHTDGTVSCWGSNVYGQIGDGTPVGDRKGTPVKLTTISNVAQLALGENFSCARLTTGEVKCWGTNSVGQLGIEPTGNLTATNARNTPVTVAGITNAVDIVAGYSHACAKLADGTHKCWGSDSSGQLGISTVFDYNTPTRNPGLANVTQISMSPTFTAGGHGCAVLSDKSLKCWGRGREGQIGTLGLTDSFTPIAVAGMTAVEQIVTGEKHTCARLTGGAISCWGDNWYGLLGNGGSTAITSAPTAAPVAVSGITTAKQIVAGARFNCALLTDGKVTCWGANTDGQLGDGTTTHQSTPKELTTLADVSMIAAGEGHACAISSLDGSVSCWGDNDNYQAGNSASTSDVKTPVKLALPTGTTATGLALGQNHTCILLSDKTVACFGDNAYGQIANGTTTDVKTPTVVAGLSDVTKIWSGDNYTCALRGDGVVRCWGFNGNGQIADGSFDNRNTPGPALIGLPAWTDLGLGRGSACAVLADGTARCWGGIYWGALGDGNSEYRWTPIQLPL